MRRPKIVAQIRDAIHKVDPKATTILYGSEARGDARPDSDIDLLILVDGDKLSYDHEGEFTMPLYEIEWKTGVPVSPMVMLRKDWEHRPLVTPFYLNVKNEGIIL